MSAEEYWSQLEAPKKRLVLLWLLILRTAKEEDVASNYLEPLFLDRAGVVADALPAFLFRLQPRSLALEISEVGGLPKFIQGQI